ncbi:hypothetical protein [Nocardia stercoris]|uniref:WXG100 family type VII secretion target n=1 Tax=Nocardia stercoris TaxID=2483361 RepID=A0A3M2KPW6_9NOCA|nr:hypothetical protein [Nocardia stercoris]RMI27707.1 hypothetical protein EBN03_33085 [Nocardia stercoris]
MADEVWVDAQNVDHVSRQLDDIAAQAAAALADLQATLGGSAAPWGADDLGRTFARTYVPDEHKMLGDLQLTVTNLAAEGANLRDYLSTVDQVDQVGRRSLDPAGPQGPPVLPAPVVTAPSRTDAPSGLDTAVPGMDTAVPGTDTAVPGTDTAVPGVDAAAPDAGRVTTPGPDSPQAGGPAPGAALPPGAPAGLSPGAEPEAAAPDRLTGNTTVPPVPSGPPGAPTPRTPWTKKAVTPNPGPVPGATATPAAASSQPPLGSPWSRPGTGRAGGARGAQNPMSRNGIRPPTPRGRRDRKDALAGRTGSGADPVAMLGRALADRHAVEVSGFDDDAGLDYATVYEFATTVDELLTTYPDRGVEAVAIAELPGADVATREVRDGDRPHRIVLSRAVARVPVPADGRSGIDVAQPDPAGAVRAAVAAISESLAAERGPAGSAPRPPTGSGVIAPAAQLRTSD